MSPEASSEWLENIGQMIASVRTALTTIGLFVAAITLTLVIQRRDLWAYRHQQTAIASANPSDWKVVQKVYEDIPPDYDQNEIYAWYIASLQSSFLATILQEGNADALSQSSDSESQAFASAIKAIGNDKPSPADVLSISTAFKSLRDLNLNFRTVQWAIDAKKDFNDLSSDELQALIYAYAYQPDSATTRGIDKTSTFCDLFFAHHLDQLKNSRGKPLFSDEFNSVMKKGGELQTFVPLRAEVMKADLETFQANALPPDRIAALNQILQNASISSLGELYRQNSQLEDKVADIRDLSTTINVPLLDLSISRH